MSRSPVPLVLAGVLAGALSACGTGDEAGAHALDPTVAALLADSADRAAQAVDAEDHCAALVELDALGARADESQTAGQLPGDVASELERVATAVRGDLACEDDETQRTEAAPVEPEPDGADDAAPDDAEPTDDGATDGRRVEADLDVGTDAGDVDIEVQLRPADGPGDGPDDADRPRGRSDDRPGRGRGRGDGP
ncbi:hypothetical protein FTX61_06050 [Nitriliruptoraceae bacterium ZYF776]|nr:hypothetical protein [Profundirhabdus halotolerans]